MTGKRNLALYRLGDGKEKLNSARILFDQGGFKDSVSRSYYAMFSAARALLATKSVDSAKHSGVIALFHQCFVKTGIISKEYGKLLAKAKNVREESDYGDFVVVSREEAEIQLQQARAFITEVENVLETK